MKRCLILCLTAMLLLSCVCPASAMDSKVIYTEDAERFFFVPGSRYSPTDLFPNFKDVMPGDSLQQQIEIKNPTSNECKIQVYLRALGAHPRSVEFLSQMSLTVEETDDTVLFDAPANRRAQLKDWVYLGTLYSGGECELTVTLDVPVTLDNRFQHEIGFLDWEFAVTELPVEDSDPVPPQTGDNTQLLSWAGLLAISLVSLIWFLLFPRKKKEKE